MIIKTKEFTLRPIRISDSKAYFESMQDKQSKLGFMSTPKTLAEAKKEITHRLKEMKKKPISGIYLAIEVDSQYAGDVSLKCLNQKFLLHYGNVSYCIHPKFRGRGLASKALKLLSNYGFKHLKLRRIEGTCRTFNKASVRTLKKSGFKLEGILKKNKWKDGKYLDDMIWAKVR